MNQPLCVDGLAKREAGEAAAWYEDQEPGLGLRFLDHFEAALEEIESAPEACSPIPGTELPLRAARVRKFPYRVVFLEMPDRLRVLAVSHTSRLPQYWIDRLRRPPG